VQAVVTDVAEMLASFRERFNASAAADREERKQNLNELRAEVRALTQEAQAQMKRYRDELDAAAAAGRVERANAADEAAAFVARNREAVQHLLQDIRADLDALREQGRAERRAFLDDIQAQAYAALNTARAVIGDVQTEVEQLHRTWRGTAPEETPHTASAGAVAPANVHDADDHDADDDGADVDSTDDRNNVAVLKGIGPKTGAQLREAGIVTFQDLAAYTADEIRQMLTDLPAFVDVESWVAQARQQVRTHRR